MSRLSRCVLPGAVAAAALVAAPRARAQVAPVNPFSFGVSAGAAIPTGDAADDLSTGYSVDGIIGVRAPTLPVSFRGEVGYTRFGFKDGDGAGFRMISGVANVLYTFSAGPTAVVRPYVIGGVGVYNGRAVGDGFDDAESRTKVGFNGGVGLEIPLSGITGFGEVRFANVRFAERGEGSGANLNYIPIRFGIRF